MELECIKGLFSRHVPGPVACVTLLQERETTCRSSLPRWTAVSVTARAMHGALRMHSVLLLPLRLLQFSSSSLVDSATPLLYVAHEWKLACCC